MKEYTILTINPGSTSTKIGVYKNESALFELTVRHSTKLLESYSKIWEQYSFRKKEILEALFEHNIDVSKIDAIVARGGLIRPISSGVYIIDEEMIEDARKGVQGQHASNLGCVIGYGIGWEYDIPAYIVDPPAVDELEPLARVSGNGKIERNSLFHALNIFATGRVHAQKINEKFENLNLIVAHLGGGITVAALNKGKAINVNNGLDEGPFSPERSGSLPLFKVIDMAYSGEYSKEQLKKMVVGKGGFVSYFGNNNSFEVETLANEGSEKHRLIFEAMGYQISQEIGARATNLKGKIDGIVLTGGLAHAAMLVDWIKERVSFMAPVYVYPGENELKALALGGLRVLKGEESPKHYTDVKKKVGVIYWVNIGYYDQAIETFETVFKNHGYQIRNQYSNLELIYKNCQGSEEATLEALKGFEKDSVDAVIAIGTPASIRANHYYLNKKTPLICTGIYNTDVLEFNQNSKGTNENIYSSYYSIAIEEQLEKTVLLIKKDIKRVGIVFKLGERHSEIQHDSLKSWGDKNGVQIFSFNIQKEDDFKLAKEYFIENDIEFLVLDANTTTATTPKAIISDITERFPTLSAISSKVSEGALFSYMTPWDEVAKLSAQMTIQILNGEQPAQKSASPKDKKLYVNKQIAERFSLISTIKKELSSIEWV
ncbi:butyrate kinase [bacterium]|nr:butyrate kinase [bacterium]